MLMSLTDYAKHRGVSKMTVSNAVRKGRLRESVAYSGAGKPKIRDVALADKEWEENLDLSTAPAAVREKFDEGPSAHDGMSLSEASAVEKVWRAKTAELKFREAAKELIPARDVEARLVSVFTECKTKLLGIPSRARQALPHLTVADIGTLEGLIREALEGLAE